MLLTTTFTRVFYGRVRDYEIAATTVRDYEIAATVRDGEIAATVRDGEIAATVRNLAMIIRI